MLASGALLTVQADGSYRYDPNGQFASLRAGQSATDAFTYMLADAAGATSTAAVTITTPLVPQTSLASQRASFCDTSRSA